MQDYVCNVAHLMPISIVQIIILSPSCSCDDFESVNHFFYVCPQLTAVRERHLGDVLRNHTTHEPLCGKPEFSNNENVSLFLKVSKGAKM